MSARVEKTVPARRLKTEQVIVNFEAERLKAPLLLRCGAGLIDYIILICIPVLSLLLSRIMGVPDAKLLNNEFTNVGWLVMLLFGLTNIVIFPLLNGQSIGKMITRLRIVNINGEDLTFKNILVRHLIGYPLTILTVGIGFIFSALNAKGRALHDFVAGTVVIYGKRNILK